MGGGGGADITDREVQTRPDFYTQKGPTSN